MNQLPQKLRVIELAAVLAGPSVGMFLAELGAEVIKVENPQGGDVTRSWKLAGETAETDRPAYFCSVNWGKKSVCLDLTKAEDQRKLATLLANADVLLTSFKPGDAEKFGLHWEKLHATYPRLIVGEISGYGPDQTRVGYDAIIQAEAGFTAINGLPGQTFKMPVALVDVLAAHQLKAGLLLALWQRSVDGQGKRVHVSLLQAAIAALVNQGANYLVGGVEPQPLGNEHPNIVPYGRPFVCADGEVLVLAVGTDKQFESLCKLLGLDALATQPPFNTNEGRVKGREQLYALLDEAFARFKAAELLEQLHKAHIPAGKMHTMAAVADLPAARALLVTQAGLQGWRSAVFVKESPDLLPPPHLGEHQALLA